MFTLLRRRILSSESPRSLKKKKKSFEYQLRTLKHCARVVSSLNSSLSSFRLTSTRWERARTSPSNFMSSTRMNSRKMLAWPMSNSHLPLAWTQVSLTVALRNLIERNSEVMSILWLTLALRNLQSRTLLMILRLSKREKSWSGISGKSSMRTSERVWWGIDRRF